MCWIQGAGPRLLLVWCAALGEAAAGEPFPSARDAYWGAAVLLLVVLATWLAVRRSERAQADVAPAEQTPPPSAVIPGDAPGEASGERRARKEAADRTTEVLVRHGSSIARIGSWERDLRTGKVAWSEQVHRLFGIARQDSPGTYPAILALIHPEDRAGVDATLAAAIAQRQEYRNEFRVVWPDGSVHWLVGSGEVTRDAAGEPLRVSGVLLDVSERKQMEDALRHSEERLREGLTAAGMGAWEWDIASGRVTWSPGVEALFDLDQGAFAGTYDAYLALVPAEHRQRVQGAINHALAQGEQLAVEHPVALRAGGERWLAARGRVLRDGQGRPQAMRGVLMDVTARQLIEHELRQSEERYRAVVSAMHEGVIIHANDGVVVACNRSAERILALTHAQILGAGVAGAPWPWRAVREDGSDFPPAEQPGHLAQQSGQPQHGVTCGLRLPDGALRWLLVNADPLMAPGSMRPVGAVVTFTDITDRKTSDRTMRESEQRLRTLAESDPNIVYMIDRTGTILFINRTMARGDRQTVLGSNIRDQVRPEAQPAYLAAIARVFETGELVEAEVEALHPDGGWSWYLSRIGPMRSGGRIIAVVVTTMDITDRKRVEEERRTFQREREALLERLQTQIERMPIVFMEFDAQFRIVSINPAAERVFGWSAAEVRGRHVLDVFIPPERRPEMEGLLTRIAAGDLSVRGRDSGLAKDGRRVLCEWYNTPLMGPDGSFLGAFTMAVDVSEQKQLEEQLRQSQKMEAVGKLAGGIAHDFNNLLTAIMGYGDLLMLRHPPGDTSHNHLAQIKKSAQRAAALTHQLLAFSRKQVLQPKVINLNDTVREMEGLLRRLIGEHIEMRLALEPGLWRVRADVSQLEQVVMNLAVNARDAMSRGGCLSLSTRNRPVRSDEARQLAEVETGDYVQLTVADTGEGMDDTTKARIFEPFFTTKRDGKGTGLGLSVVFGVVKQSGGHIFVISEPGKGSTFEILLPRAKEAEAEPQSRTSVLMPAFGTETVLLVEDDEAVRGFVRDTLCASGYTVIDVADGRKALEIAPYYPRQIHLLLTDVVMPQVGGRELAEQLVKLRQGLKVLYMSGYTDDMTLAHGVSDGVAALIEKPFTSHALLTQVRRVLSG